MTDATLRASPSQEANGLGLDDRAGFAALLETWAAAIAPRRPPSIEAWSDRYRQLSAKSAAEPGRWRCARTPYVRGVMAALDPRHPAPLVVYVKSAQVSGSEIGLCWVGRTVHVDPASFLCLFPTEKVGRKWVRSRLDPMIAATPELRARVPLGRRASSGNTLQEKHFEGGVLYTGSANIPDDVASISVPNLLLEEVDRMPQTLEGEGDPIELALRRSTTFPRRKAFMVSTPTSDETSRIWPAWQSSTQDRFCVPCPHCGHFQHLRWEQLKWSEGKPASAAYACESCGAMIGEHEKPAMLAAGEWRSTYPDREAEVKGFHLNGLYTPLGLGDSWGQHAKAWERIGGDKGRLQVFFNTRLGELHKSERRKLSWETVAGRREPYKLRQVPEDVLLLTSGTDVQADRLETQVVGWGRGERATVIDYRVHFGDPTRPDIWDELDRYLGTLFPAARGGAMAIKLSLVDSGYLTTNVLAFTRGRQRAGVYASVGSTIATKDPIGKPTYPDAKMRARRVEADRRGVERYSIGVSRLKHWLFERLTADEGSPDEPVLPTARHIRFSEELPEEYFRQLTAEIFDPRQGWLQRANYHRNEALDTFVLARAAVMHHKIAIHRFQDAEWAHYESAAQTGEAPASSAPGERAKAMTPRIEQIPFDRWNRN